MQPLIENSGTDVSSKEMEPKTRLDKRFAKYIFVLRNPILKNDGSLL